MVVQVQQVDAIPETLSVPLFVLVVAAVADVPVLAVVAVVRKGGLRQSSGPYAEFQRPDLLPLLDAPHFVPVVTSHHEQVFECVGEFPPLVARRFSDRPLLIALFLRVLVE